MYMFFGSAYPKKYFFPENPSAAPKSVLDDLKQTMYFSNYTELRNFYNSLNGLKVGVEISQNDKNRLLENFKNSLRKQFRIGINIYNKNQAKILMDMIHPDRYAFISQEIDKYSTTKKKETKNGFITESVPDMNEYRGFIRIINKNDKEYWNIKHFRKYTMSRETPIQIYFDKGLLDAQNRKMNAMAYQLEQSQKTIQQMQMKMDNKELSDAIGKDFDFMMQRGMRIANIKNATHNKLISLDQALKGNMKLKGHQSNVVNLQKALNKRGATLKVDGIFGIKTYNAIQEYNKRIPD